MNYWLVKSEPSAYSWQQLLKEGRAVWDGVRNYQARNFMRQMIQGDKVFFYHSIKGKEIVGIAEVAKEAYPDPTDNTNIWSAVELTPLKPLLKPVKIEDIKAEKQLNNVLLIKQSRLSVMPLLKDEFDLICRMGL